MNPNEVHLFLIWPKAFHAMDRIAEDIASTLIIKDVVEIAWSNELFSSNLTRFYGLALPHAKAKERQCGRGPVRAYVVQDDAACHELRQTTKGARMVNARVFDARERYREWAGGGFLVHSSLTTTEARHDIRMLLDVDLSEYLLRAPVPSTRVQTRRTELVGARSWHSLKQLDSALDVVSRVIFLFGFRDSDLVVADGRPIVILAEDRWEAVLALNGRPAGRSHGRLFYDADVGGRRMRFDVRQTGEGYFDPKWEREMIANRVRQCGMYVASAEDQRYAALYEALARNRVWLSESDWSAAMACRAPLSDGSSELNEFLGRQGYAWVRLKRPGVPVPGEKMPLRWHLWAAWKRVGRLATSVNKHGLVRAVGIVARRVVRS